MHMAKNLLHFRLNYIASFFHAIIIIFQFILILSTSVSFVFSYHQNTVTFTMLIMAKFPACRESFIPEGLLTNIPSDRTSLAQ